MIDKDENRLKVTDSKINSITDLATEGGKASVLWHKNSSNSILISLNSAENIQNTDPKALKKSMFVKNIADDTSVSDDLESDESNSATTSKGSVNQNFIQMLKQKSNPFQIMNELSNNIRKAVRKSKSSCQISK